MGKTIEFINLFKDEKFEGLDWRIIRFTTEESVAHIDRMLTSQLLRFLDELNEEDFDLFAFVLD